MKKILLFLLFTLPCNLTLYSLTKQDWIIINALMFGMGSAETFIGYKLGKQYGSEIEFRHYYVPPVSTIEGEALRAMRAGRHALLNKEIRKRRSKVELYSRGSRLLGGILGGGIGLLGGTSLAVSYIVYKYGVSYKEAWNAIRYNLDLSEKAKK